MRLAGTEYSLASRSFDIFISGCTRNCPGCFNPEAQDFSFGESLNDIILGGIMLKISAASKLIDNIRLMGGDPMCQKESEIQWMTKVLRETFPRKSLQMYTGAELSEVPQWCLETFDTIKTGQYIEALRQSTGLASSNQCINVKGRDYL